MTTALSKSFGFFWNCLTKSGYVCPKTLKSCFKCQNEKKQSSNFNRFWKSTHTKWFAEDCSKSSKTKNHVNVPAIVTASLWQSLLNSLYDERVITHPQAGPREKIICLAASFQISNVRRFSHLGVVKAFRPSNAPGRLKLRKAKMITEKNHFERETS